MRTTISVVFAAALVSSGAFGPPARAQAPVTIAAPAVPQVQTTGRAESRIAPDRALVMIGVQSRAATAAAAAADNARRQRAVLDTVRAAGISSELISTMNYTVSPEMQYSAGQPPRITGYNVSNTVRVDVHRLEDVGRVIDASLAKGANEISGLEFYSSKTDSVRRATLALAVADARVDAEVLAAAAGGSLGQLIELTTQPADVRPVPIMAMQRVAAATSTPTPVEPGQEAVAVAVTAKWAFVPRR